MSHTKGKITFNKAEGWLQGSDGKRIGTTCLTVSRDDDENRANARHIVACWNACDGVKTESLEGNDDIHQPMLTLAKANQLLRDERDELVKALREQRSAWDEAKSFSEMRKMHDSCDAILARYPEGKS